MLRFAMRPILLVRHGRYFSRFALVVGALLHASSVSAQDVPPPLPPPEEPPSVDRQIPGDGQPPSPRYAPAPPGYGEAPPGGRSQPPPGSPYYYPPRALPPELPPPSEPPTHAPKYSLWTGARLSFVSFGFGFYENERHEPETTGNYLGNGIAPQIDLGARISYRYIPYLYWEHGFMGQGHRFEGTDARSTTDFYGVGFRYASGDVDSVAFLTDLSIGKRVIRVSNGNQTYSMSGLEYFRLGLGAEIRVATLFALTPLLSLSSGSLNDSDGTVDFGCNPSCTEKGDGLTKPTYTNGKVIANARTYVVLSLGLGIHFDVFGK